MNKKDIWIIIAVIVLIGGLAFLTFLLLSEKKANEEMSQLFEIEKKEMENEYTNFANQYDELQIITSNDSLATLLDEEKVKVQRLLEELRSVKSTNAAEIARLRKELNTVRNVLRTYVIQIDSLNKVNQALTTENKEVKQKYSEATRQISSLAQEKKNLNEKVSLASQLDATGVWVEAKNKRGKIAKKVKDVTKLAIGFSIVKNITATTGERIIYIQIRKPDNDILTKSSSDTFQYENRQIPFSIKKYVEYTGEEQAVTVYWDVEEFLYAGTYRVDIFADGTLIGSNSFKLN